MSEKSWAELAAERQLEKEAVYEFEIVEGMPKFKFRKEDMIDFLQAGKLPDEIVKYIYENYIDRKTEVTEEEIKKDIIQRFNDHIEMTLCIACHLSIDPKLTMNPVVNGKDEFPVRLLDQGERFRLINAISRITVERAESLKPFRIESEHEADKSDGEDISVPAIDSSEMVAD